MLLTCHDCSAQVFVRCLLSSWWPFPLLFFCAFFPFSLLSVLAFLLCLQPISWSIQAVITGLIYSVCDHGANLVLCVSVPLSDWRLTGAHWSLPVCHPQCSFVCTSCTLSTLSSSSVSAANAAFFVFLTRHVGFVLVPLASPADYFSCFFPPLSVCGTSCAFFHILIISKCLRVISQPQNLWAPGCVHPKTITWEFGRGASWYFVVRRSRLLVCWQSLTPGVLDVLSHSYLTLKRCFQHLLFFIHLSVDMP